MDEFLLNYLNNIPIGGDLFCKNFQDAAGLPPIGSKLFITEDLSDYFLTEDGLDNFITE